MTFTAGLLENKSNTELSLSRSAPSLRARRVCGYQCSVVGKRQSGIRIDCCRRSAKRRFAVSVELLVGCLGNIERFERENYTFRLAKTELFEQTKVPVKEPRLPEIRTTCDTTVYHRPVVDGVAIVLRIG